MILTATLANARATQSTSTLTLSASAATWTPTTEASRRNGIASTTPKKVIKTLRFTLFIGLVQPLLPEVTFDLNSVVGDWFHYKRRAVRAKALKSSIFDDLESNRSVGLSP